MNQLTTMQPNQELVIDSYSDVSTDNTNLVINPQAFHQLTVFAEMMAKSKMTVPVHLRGNSSDCLAVCMQAMQWGMNPFAVAQKTFQVNGVLGYEAQLVNAVITSRAPIIGRLQFEWFGEWDRIIGRFKEVPSKNNPNENRIVRDWTIADEKGLGVRVWATLKGEDEPRVLELLLSQAGVRNSPLWGQDPKQQLAYLAIKRWSRLYCPDVILGVYTPDELEDRRTEPKDVTPTPAKNGGTASIKDRIKAKKAEPTIEAQSIECYDIDPILDHIKQIENMQQVKLVGQQIKALTDDPNVNLCGNDADILRNALVTQRAKLIYNDLEYRINQANSENADSIRAEMYANQDKLSDEQFAELDAKLDDILNAQVTV